MKCENISNKAIFGFIKSENFITKKGWLFFFLPKLRFNAKINGRLLGGGGCGSSDG